MEDIDGKKVALVCGVLFTALVLCILGGYALNVFDLRMQRAVINPEIVKNKIDAPNNVIGDNTDFHTKLGLIVKTDNDIISTLNMLKKYKPGDPMYDQLQQNLAGQEQIRSSAITGYNAMATNSMKQHHMDPNLPSSVSTDPLPADDGQVITKLTQEISDLGPYTK